MCELTQAIRVKARLLIATDRDAVEYVAQRLHELDDPIGIAALALAIFDGDAPHCEHVVRRAMKDQPAWVHDVFAARWELNLAVDMPSMLMHHLMLRRAAWPPC